MKAMKASPAKLGPSPAGLGRPEPLSGESYRVEGLGFTVWGFGFRCAPSPRDSKRGHAVNVEWDHLKENRSQGGQGRNKGNKGRKGVEKQGRRIQGSQLKTCFKGREGGRGGREKAEDPKT